MAGFSTDDVIEWRATSDWVLRWLAFHLFLALPFLALGAWLAAKSIAEAPEGAWPAYLFFLGAFATLILGALTLAILVSVVGLAGLLFDKRPVLRADRSGVEVRLPLRAPRTVSWDDIASIEIERTRQSGRRLVTLNQITIKVRDGTAEIAFQPAMAGLTLESAHEALNALWVRRRRQEA